MTDPRTAASDRSSPPDRATAELSGDAQAARPSSPARAIAPRRAQPTQFALFLLVGAVAAAANISARWLLSFIMPFEAAIVVAFAVGVAIAFFLNRVIVFQTRARAGQQFRRFVAVNLLALGQVWLVSVGLARWALPLIHFTWHAETVSHVVGVASPAVTSYFAHKHFSFA